MILKANLHFHTSEDPLDLFIKYDVYDGIDRAQELGYKVLALTCHNKFTYKEEYGQYAKSKGVLLIPGIEIDINNQHILLLDCNKDVEKIKTFSDLREYRKSNSRSFVIAPHPFFGPLSLNGNLLKNLDLFDAIEGSWFFLRLFNRNKKAETVSINHNKPYIATSDTHRLRYLDKSFSLVDSDDFTTGSVLNSIRLGRFENVMKRLTIFELAEYVTWYCSSKLKVFIVGRLDSVPAYRLRGFLLSFTRSMRGGFFFSFALTSFSLYFYLFLFHK